MQVQPKDGLLHVTAAGLSAVQSRLLAAMRENFGHPPLGVMLEEIGVVLDSDTHAHKQPFISRTQQCFAVKNGADGLLDIARATFCRLTEEVHLLVASYREQVGLEMKVKLSYPASRPKKRGLSAGHHTVYTTFLNIV